MFLVVHVRISPHKRLLHTEIGLQRDLFLKSNDWKQSPRNFRVLKVKLPAILGVPNLPRLEVNTTANRVAGTVLLVR
jgi:hypothetical protein